MSEYRCPKCGSTEYISEIIQTTGGNFAKLFDVQNKKFIAISCRNCGYTELYRQDSSTAVNILDFLMGN